VDGAPPIHTSSKLEQKINLYISSREVSLVDWSQTNRGMLIQMDSLKTNVPQTYCLDTPMGRPRRLTSFKTGPTNSLWQPGKKGGIIITKDDSGNEVWQVYSFNPKTNTTTLLSDGKFNNACPGPPIWNPTRDRIAFASVHQSGNTVGVSIVNPDDPSTLREIAQIPTTLLDVNDWSPDGKHLIAASGDLLARNRLILVDTTTGAKIDVTPSEQAALYMPIGFTADSRGIFIATNLNSEFRRLAYLDLETKALSILTPDTCDIDAYMYGDYEWPALSPDRKRLAFALNRDGLSTLHIMDTATKAIHNLPCPKLGLVRNLRWDSGSKSIAFNLVSNQTSGDIYSINIDTGKTVRWTKFGNPGLDLSKNSVPELIKWKSFDQLELSGWLYRPPTTFKGKRPVIILLHGGPIHEARPEQLAYRNYYINELGLATICPNFRGSSGFGKTFVDLDNGFKREDALKDIEALLDFIQQDPTLDSSRIMIAGGSYGGYMSLALATRLGDRAACYVASSGMSNLVTMFEQDTPSFAAVDATEYGDPKDPKVKAFLTSISPINNVHKIKSPILIEAGANDPRVLVAQADTMVAAIKAHGTPVWYLRAGNDGHALSKKETSRFSMLTTIELINTYLLDQR
jgi:dipeptidyl aminopeptidase/acylaminoacyl peptidase